jgi:nucleoside-diphosphate-sugar epimerase
MHHPRLEVRQADFRQVDVVVGAMADQEAVIHLGAIVGDPACALDEELTVQVNLMATRMIGEVAKGCGVTRFLFASTCSVYGASDEWLDEHSTLNPVSLYARSKIASEKVLLRLASERFAPTILRFGTIYGFSGRMRFDLVVNLLTAKAHFEGQIPVHGGDQWRPFLHVDDAASAVYLALRAPRGVVQNQIFNVGSNAQNYTITQIGEAIQRLTPHARVLQSGSDVDKRNYRVNFSKIARELNFTPRWTLDAGILQVARAIENGSVQDYQDAQYSNVRFLSEEGPQLLTRQESQWAYSLLNA